MALTLTITDLADGTGATATIAGSSGANTVYTQAFDGDLGSGAWTSGGTRSGDGDVTLSLAAGHYFAYVVNAGVASPVVYLVVTTGASSVVKQILDAVQARLRLIAYSDIDAANIEIREIRTDENMELPCCIVSESQLAVGMNPKDGPLSRDDVVYPIDVAFFAASNRSHLDIGQHTLWLERAAKAFRNQRLSGVVTVTKCEVTPGIPVDRDAWVSNKFVGALTLKFTSRETRGLT